MMTNEKSTETVASVESRNPTTNINNKQKPVISEKRQAIDSKCTIVVDQWFFIIICPIAMKPPELHVKLQVQKLTCELDKKVTTKYKVCSNVDLDKSSHLLSQHQSRSLFKLRNLVLMTGLRAVLALKTVLRNADPVARTMRIWKRKKKLMRENMHATLNSRYALSLPFLRLALNFFRCHVSQLTNTTTIQT